MRLTNNQTHKKISVPTELLLLVLFVFLLAAYALLRYGGQWGETDAATFSHHIRVLFETGDLISDNKVYPNGYAFQALVVFLMHTTGLSIVQLQLVGGTLLATWVAFPAWLLYRELTGSSRGATLASIILFVQPEFLFPLMRGTHEKFTRGLMLLALYLLIKGFRSRSNMSRFGGTVLAFYLTIFALITFNNLLATSFMVGVGLALLLSWGVTRPFRQQNGITSRRLAYALLGSVLLAFLFTFHVYRPAEHDLLILQSVWEQLAALLLDVERTSSNPYAVVNSGWISLGVYFWVSLANWLLLVTSAAAWLWQSWGLVRDRERPFTERELLLWAFYGAFGFIGFLSILIDVSGAIAGNLQHRLFPSFTMLAAPVVAHWFMTRPQTNMRLNRVIQFGLTILLAGLAVTSIFKATNEPLLSNKWLFYVPGEMQAIEWANEGLAERTLWTSYDERLETAVRIQTELDEFDVALDKYTPEIDTRDFLISDVIRGRSERLAEPLPVSADDLITYDNGQAQIMHTRPQTPYQR